MKIKEENLKYDFLPLMFEIIDKPENKYSSIIIILILALIITSVIWAAFAKTDIAVTAQGSIITKDNLIAVTNVYGGEVISIGDAAVSVEGLGNVYLVEVSFGEAPEELLRIGQEGSCDISLGKRTILNYFLEPFIDGLKDSMHER